MIATSPDPGPEGSSGSVPVEVFPLSGQLTTGISIGEQDIDTAQIVINDRISFFILIMQLVINVVLQRY